MATQPRLVQCAGARTESRPCVGRQVVGGTRCLKEGQWPSREQDDAKPNPTGPRRGNHEGHGSRGIVANWLSAVPGRINPIWIQTQLEGVLRKSGTRQSAWSNGYQCDISTGSDRASKGGPTDRTNRPDTRRSQRTTPPEMADYRRRSEGSIPEKMRIDNLLFRRREHAPVAANGGRCRRARTPPADIIPLHHRPSWSPWAGG